MNDKPIDVLDTSPARLDDYPWPFREPQHSAGDEDQGSPLWWLRVLSDRLQTERGDMVLMDRYYRGDHPLPFVPRELESEFREMLSRSRMNFMELVVDAIVERLRVIGFRWSGREGVASDLAAWDIWQANGLDAAQVMGFTDALVKRRAYLSVWLPPEGERWPRIVFEDACQMITARDPENPQRTLAALKMWCDEWTGEEFANVWLPDAIYKFRKAAPGARVEWVERAEPVINPVGVVSVFPLVNRQRLSPYPEGESELAIVYPAQDRINETLFNRSLAAWTAAYRQKWATGISIPKDPDTNEPVEPFQAAIDRLWATENPNAKFGDFGVTDLKNFIDAIEQDVQHIAVVKRLPRHYFMQQGQAPSGDSIHSATAGLVATVRGKQLAFGEALEAAMRMAWRFAGRGDAPPDTEIVWQDPEHVTMGELSDALIKQVQAKLIPVEIARERLGMTTTEAARAAAMVEQATLLEGLSTEGDGTGGDDGAAGTAA